jgi:opacity protein-like surface antigen
MEEFKMKRLLLAVFIAMQLAVPTVAAAASMPRDKDANAMMWGGAYSASEFNHKLQQGDGHNSAATLQRDFKGFSVQGAVNRRHRCAKLWPH